MKICVAGQGAFGQKHLDALKRIPGIVTVVAMLFVWSILFLMPESIYRLQAWFTGVEKEQLALMTTCFLTLIKCLGVTLFLFPWVAIRLFLRSVSKVAGRKQY